MIKRKKKKWGREQVYVLQGFNSLDCGERLQETSLLGELVKAVVRGTLVTDEPAEGEGGELASVETLLVNVANVNLDGSVVLGGDQAVGGRAIVVVSKYVGEGWQVNVVGRRA